jgi:hypothetical protein
MEKEPIRKILIDAIIEMAGDEFEKPADWIKLAKKTDRELVLEMINIAEYFRQQSKYN